MKVLHLQATVTAQLVDNVDEHHDTDTWQEAICRDWTLRGEIAVCTVGACKRM